MIPDMVRSFVLEQHPSDATLYLLLDPLAGCSTDDPLHVTALRRNLGEGAITRVHRPDLAYSERTCPVLVTLAAPNHPPPQALLSLSADYAEAEAGRSKRYVCGWLSSMAKADIVGPHITSLGRLPTQQEQWFYPIHEPLRLELLAVSFKVKGQGPWWPIERWLFPNSFGTCSMLAGHPDQYAKPELRATELQQDWAVMSVLLKSWRHALREPARFAARRWNGPSLLPPHAASRLCAPITEARELGLRTQHDLLTLTLLRRLVHPQLHQHSTVHNLIKQALQEQCPLSIAFADHSDRDWHRVISDLELAQVQQ